ncbi:DUF792 family protein [Borrelia hermsii]|uniref:Uncharacterized protein n=2 Tax=Borrelia hermsii TaxID=140 RepID=A0AAN1CFN0_BORHE|nr:DUF792 family protein [Borrelia hermsii]AMR76195.1 hypothetical protein A0V01_06310 [Borrelia hermsii]ANA43815.1 hypothetical protein AXX13_P11 [Borrelia hermsii HS1]UPA08224.1 DUF792 family protein [Borrelia hermsii DAH]UPA08243.1 DUF792 family protein [Borrelia hermsii DAH]UPA08288.1 DUF792 family protein [Borrelia hermsii DAH]
MIPQLTTDFIHKYKDTAPVKATLDFLKLTPSQVTSILKETFNEISSVFMAYNFLSLCPRMDFKGLGYVPQGFFILPKTELISTTYTTTCSKRPVIDYYTRKSEYVSYNPTFTGEVITLNNAVLTSAYKELLKFSANTAFGKLIFPHTSNLAKQQLINRVEESVPFSFYSPTLGFRGIVAITSLTLKDTVYLDEVEISLTLEVLKTFSIYKG